MPTDGWICHDCCPPCYARGRRHVLLEGGPTLAGAFFDADLVDEVVVYLAPLLIGAGRSAVDSAAVSTLTQARPLELREMGSLGPDLRLRYAVAQILTRDLGES